MVKSATWRHGQVIWIERLLQFVSVEEHAVRRIVPIQFGDTIEDNGSVGSTKEIHLALTRADPRIDISLFAGVIETEPPQEKVQGTSVFKVGGAMWHDFLVGLDHKDEALLANVIEVRSWY